MTQLGGRHNIDFATWNILPGACHRRSDENQKSPSRRLAWSCALLLPRGINLGALDTYGMESYWMSRYVQANLNRAFFVLYSIVLGIGEWPWSMAGIFATA
jgi:hypothetical protein